MRKLLMGLLIVGIIVAVIIPKDYDGKVLTVGPTVVLNENSEASEVFVFIHGIYGHSQDTWRVDSKSKALYDYVAERPVFNAPKVISIGYNSPMTGNDEDVSQIAQKLWMSLKRRGVDKCDNIYFVCHSMGGLIAKSMILRLPYEDAHVRDRIRALYFFAVPNNGANIAKLGAKLSYNAQLESMFPAGMNAFIRNMREDFVKFSLPIYMAYESSPTLGIKVVPYESATGAGVSSPLKPVSLRGNHNEIVKPNAAGNGEIEVLTVLETWHDHVQATLWIQNQEKLHALSRTLQILANNIWQGLHDKLDMEKLRSTFNLGGGGNVLERLHLVDVSVYPMATQYDMAYSYAFIYYVLSQINPAGELTGVPGGEDARSLSKIHLDLMDEIRRRVFMDDALTKVFHGNTDEMLYVREFIRGADDDINLTAKQIKERLNGAK